MRDSGKMFPLSFFNENGKDHSPKDALFGSLTPLIAACRIKNPASEAVFTEVKTASDISAQARPLCLTIGNFDGIHLGHRSLIELGRQIANQRRLKFAVMTFWPHPRVVLQGADAHHLLTSRQDRLDLLAAFSGGHVIEVPFTRELAALEPEQFARQFLQPLNVRELVVGHDFTLGKNRSGNVETLTRLGRKYGFALTQASAFLVNGLPVSSTRLRGAIRQGQMESAAGMLGRPYSVTGRVGRGFQRGRVLGFPTANLENIEVLLPAQGVYAAIAISNGQHFAAVTNIGRNPTFDNADLTVESFLLDADVDLYDTKLRLEFISFLRGEHKFQSASELSAQINSDVAQARTILGAAL